MSTIYLEVSGADTGSTIYSTFRYSDTRVWNFDTSALETASNANQPHYDYALTETPSGSNFWVAQFPADLPDGTWDVTYWRQIGGTPNVTDFMLGGETFFSSGNATSLLTRAEYTTLTGSDASNDKKDMLISAASTALMNYCNFRLIAEERTEQFDGNGLNMLQLGAVPDSITTVTINPDADDAEEIDGDEFQWTRTGVLYFDPDSTAGSYFPQGWQNIRVDYESASQVDDNLKQICAQMAYRMELLLDKDQLVTTKNVGPVTIKYDKGFLGSDPLFGDLRERLNKYRRFVCI